MKILAIRGRNLASLAGEFEVDLQKPPLLHAGLFAITGPTGSGKTTLLDAICLALFDRVPRFSNIHSFRMEDGEETIDSKDVRNLLRRGAARGKAEVDFKGRDGRIYRATWQVHRAREKAAGILQKATISLYDVAKDQEIGDGKKATLKMIEEKLGLDFDQFCRSVMLAQGDFAAFLKSDPKNRSGLLERMTGTGLYSKISQRAFERAKQTRLHLKEIEDRIQNLEVLETEARQELEARLATWQGKLATLEQQQKECQTGLDWYLALEKLASDCDQATAEIVRLEKEWQDKEQERIQLNGYDAMRPVLPYLEAERQSIEQEKRDRKALDAAMLELEQAEGAHADLEQQKHRTFEKLELAKAERRQHEPQIAKARELDVQLAENAKQREKAKEELETAENNLDAAQKALETCRLQTQKASDKLAAAKAWLEDHQIVAKLVEDWSLREQEITRLIAAQHEWSNLGEQIPTARSRYEERKTEHVKAVKTLEETEQLAVEAEKKAEAARKHAKSFDPDVATHCEQLEKQHELTNQCLKCFEAVSAIKTEEQAALASATLAKKNHEEAQQKIMENTDKGKVTKLQLEEAKRALDLLRASLGFADRRHELEDGQPCPLCGSPHHPYTQNGVAPGSAAEKTQQDRVNQLDELLQNLRADHKVLEIQSREYQKTLSELDTAKPERQKQLEAATTALETTRSALREDCQYLDDFSESSLRQHLQDLSERLARAREIRKQASLANQELQKTAEIARDSARAASKAKDDTRSLERTMEESHQTLTQLEEKYETVEQDRLRLVETLQPFAPESISIPQQAESLLTHCRDSVAAYRQKQEDHQNAQEEFAASEKQSHGLEKSLDERAQSLKPLQSRHQELGNEGERLKAARAVVLDGKSVEEVLSALEGDLKQAETEAAQMRKNLEDAMSRFLTAQKSLENSRQNLEKQQARLAQDKQNLNQALAKADLTRDAVMDYTPPESDEMEALRTAFKETEKQLEHWRSLRHDRAKRLEQHRQNHQPGEARETLKDQMQVLAEAMQQAAKELESIHFELKTDDHRREQIEDFLPEKEKRRKDHLRMQKMADLIGQADGAKFRNFAQSLTLEALIEEANDHLEDLAPRYRLMRVPGYDLELQIEDIHMADEKRAIETLSGGETFLVSLALALGLSSLSANRSTSIESLFIDEGFGVLDPVTLDSALSTLDALQASGRCVGLISHISAVAERVGVRVQLTRIANGGSKIQIIDC